MKGQDWLFLPKLLSKTRSKIGAYKDLEVSVEVSKEVTDEDVDITNANATILAELSLKKVQQLKVTQWSLICWFSWMVLNLTAEKGDNFSLDLVAVNLFQIWRSIVGHKAGETVDVVVTFPKDYHSRSAGKEAKFGNHNPRSKERSSSSWRWTCKRYWWRSRNSWWIERKRPKELAEWVQLYTKTQLESAAIDLGGWKCRNRRLTRRNGSRRASPPANSRQHAAPRIFTWHVPSKLVLLKKTFTNSTKLRRRPAIKTNLWLKLLQKQKDLKQALKKLKQKFLHLQTTTIWKRSCSQLLFRRYVKTWYHYQESCWSHHKHCKWIMFEKS